ncbi:MAG: hypothetical protein U1F53_19715 [Burkholderiaceae bacterium]
MPAALNPALVHPLATPVLHGASVAAAAVLAGLFFGLVGHGLRKIRSTDTVTALGWWATGSVAGGAGLWALHFMALVGLGLPWEPRFHGWQLAGTGLTATLGLAAVLASARLAWGDTARLSLQGLGLGLLWALVQSLSLATLAEPPLASGAGRPGRCWPWAAWPPWPSPRWAWPSARAGRTWAPSACGWGWARWASRWPRA